MLLWLPFQDMLRSLFGRCCPACPRAPGQVECLPWEVRGLFDTRDSQDLRQKSNLNEVQTQRSCSQMTQLGPRAPPQPAATQSIHKSKDMRNIPEAKQKVPVFTHYQLQTHQPQKSGSYRKQAAWTLKLSNKEKEQMNGLFCASLKKGWSP